MTLRRSYYVLTLFELVFSQQVNQVCWLKSGQRGRCKQIIICNSVVEAVKAKQSEPEICGYEFSLPIVCCPEEVGDKARLKCQEYSKVVQECNLDRSELTFNKNYFAKDKEFPHMAAIGYDNKGEISWKNEGALISEQYVLTRAYGIVHRDISTLANPTSVKLGMVRVEDTANTQIIKIALLLPHPEYNHTTRYNDIGLLKLEKSVVINEFVKPICLNTRRDFGVRDAIAAGWVAQDHNSRFVLSKEFFHILEPSVYLANYGNLDLDKLTDGILDDRQLCVGLVNTTKRSCLNTWDSYLHVFSKDGNCMYDLVGIQSLARPCSMPGIYSRVSYYVKWIEDTIWPSHCGSGPCIING